MSEDKQKTTPEVSIEKWGRLHIITTKAPPVELCITEVKREVMPPVELCITEVKREVPPVKLCVTEIKPEPVPVLELHVTTTEHKLGAPVELHVTNKGRMKMNMSHR